MEIFLKKAMCVGIKLEFTFAFGIIKQKQEKNALFNIFFLAF